LNILDGIFVCAEVNCSLETACAEAYEVDAEAGPIIHCHCRTCRKTHGSAFPTVTNVPREASR